MPAQLGGQGDAEGQSVFLQELTVLPSFLRVQEVAQEPGQEAPDITAPGRRRLTVREARGGRLAIDHWVETDTFVRLGFTHSCLLLWQ
ncbi:MAG: hypothetical protein HC888_18670 [Candidatus Competibacteraceae bacterium]|nr:hypothetical protein [Candidatus Competibacteraceae bacterium]